MHRILSTCCILAVFAAVLAGPALSQTARVQAIHNSPDPSAAQVDVYLDDDLLLDDFAFRQATPFIDAPADVEIVLGVAPSTSTGAADIIASFPVTLTADETYVVIATGVLDPIQFADNPDGRETGFTLLVKEGARETAENPAQIDAFGVHGITDAPSLDVIGPEDAVVLDDAGYSDVTDYFSFEAGVISLTITPADDNDSPLAAVDVDLTGLGGASAVVVASGFLNPAMNQYGPSAAALAVFADGTVVEWPLPFPGDEDPGCTYSQGFWKNHPGDWPMDISPDDPFFESGLTWMEVLWTPPRGGNAYFILGHQYVATALNVANGADDSDIIDALDRAAELLSTTPPSGPPRGDERHEFIELAELLDGYNNGFIGPGHCDDMDDDDDMDDMAYVQVIHNAADPAVETVDVYLGDQRILDDFMFRTATPFVPVPAEMPLTVGLAPGSSESAADVIKTFSATLEEHVSYVAIAAGVLETGDFAENPDGRDTELTLLVKEGARQTAAPFVYVPEGHYPPPGECRIWMPGVPAGHQSHPVPCSEIGDDHDGTLVTHDGPVMDPADEVAFFVGHTVTDAPTVDVIARDVGLLVDDAAYGDLTDYLMVEPAEYVLDLTPGSDNETVVASFMADLTGLGGQSAVVLASGFFDSSANQDGPAFALIAVLADGTVIELTAEESGTSGRLAGATSLQSTGEIPTTLVLEANYPNPFNPSTRIEFGVPEAGETRLTVYDALGRLVRVLHDGQLAAGTYVMTFDASGLPSGTYIYRVETAQRSDARSMVLLK